MVVASKPLTPKAVAPGGGSLSPIRRSLIKSPGVQKAIGNKPIPTGVGRLAPAPGTRFQPMPGKSPTGGGMKPLPRKRPQGPLNRVSGRKY